MLTQALVDAPPIQMKNVHRRQDIGVILRMTDVCAEKNLLVSGNQQGSTATQLTANANVLIMLMNVYLLNIVTMVLVNVVVAIPVQENLQEVSVIL